MQLVNDRRGFWKAFWKSDGISGKKPEVDDPTLRATNNVGYVTPLLSVYKM
jgi:hypothetical protein